MRVMRHGAFTGVRNTGIGGRGQQARRDEQPRAAWQSISTGGALQLMGTRRPDPHLPLPEQGLQG